MSKSVTFTSSGYLLPGAETTIIRLSLSDAMISHVFFICTAEASEVPPNFATFI